MDLKNKEDVIKKIFNMTEEEKKKMLDDFYEEVCKNYSEAEINKDITENAVKYLKENDKQFENYTENEIKMFLFGMRKIANY